jgi:hypothetical protein
VHPYFGEPSNMDVLALHEAFADIVALFQHFSYPGVLRSQIATTRGNLAAENLLGQLAQQFGRASGRGSALRDALGGVNADTGRWEAHKPDVRKIDRTFEPHDRGAILVAAVFGAFLKVYRARTADLYRLASEGTGVLRDGDLPTDLASRLAEEAARSAQNVLQMCIRAIDFCPPVGITFGDYLRAIITADYELNVDDVAGYRLAFVESFRQWGIHPVGMRSMSVDSLLWPDQRAAEEAANVGTTTAELHDLFEEDQEIASAEQDNRPRRSRPKTHRLQSWTFDVDRHKQWLQADLEATTLWSWLMKGKGKKLARAFGLVLDEDHPPPTVFRSRSGDNRVAVEVHSVRRALRRTPRGDTITDVVVEITQRRRGYFDEKKQAAMDAGTTEPADAGDFRYRAGCTVLLDPTTMQVRRVIRTAGTIADNAQLERVRRYVTEGAPGPANAFEPASRAMQQHGREPFALLHRSKE